MRHSSPFSAVATLVLVLGATAAPAMAAAKPANSEDVKAYALQLCLDANYQRAGKYAEDQLRDRSFLTTTYALDNARAGATARLHEFVAKQTADFDRAEVAMKDEQRLGPYNRIFAQCMAFYRSAPLSEFVQRLR